MWFVAFLLLLVQLSWIFIDPTSYYGWGYIPLYVAIFALLVKSIFSASK